MAYCTASLSDPDASCAKPHFCHAIGAPGTGESEESEILVSYECRLPTRPPTLSPLWGLPDRVWHAFWWQT